MAFMPFPKGEAVTYKHVPEVRPDLALQSKKDIDNVNKYMDGLYGTVISIETISAGQGSRYADSVYEARIFCHQPNVLTTGAPLLRCIDEATARQLAKAFVRWWPDIPEFLSSYLEYIKPETNPCGLAEYKLREDGRSSCWHVKIVQPYCD
jgi:hypothetical protein